MASDLNLSGTNNTGINTGNPQSGAANTSLIGQQQTLQNVNNSGSINVKSSSAAPIALPPASLTTAAVQPFQAQKNRTLPVAGISIAAVLVVVAAALCIYIYLSGKKSFQNI